ncbi:UDP-N-acetylmuramoylalanine--D-glutamate ligase [Oceanobacillus picturae]|uniref:UDP-N-acetylmuramoylalanine--D-glutamate ligase n=1 Tax=Oceanobacillus picturae TaxID=171693 RepID=W9A986_9BACI|nr:UDP-N-acetylmuramoyl-L-alanine--D-glutamate ligase [Oceanobacillus picturae]RIU96454.1 UDP-N-acetylmuramoyl-L-alanine--D-glutamate ligase [Oceanobacillus picturae]GAQ18836.1 UDP-N-acetylmuramoylalanine--D-glutamate ligase [Oceanobacillus picturae]CDO02324.1 UDP-N-acetylmuramoylalanine--D-glutamate ligase [Oceanobacillus picturae]
MKQLIDFPYSNVLVLGLARSGTAAANVLLENSKSVRINDMHAKEDDETVEELKSKGAEVILGTHPLHVLDGIDIIVKNPGIPYDNIILAEAMKRDIPIITEIELAGQLADGEIIAITGSNGKTTTTTLTTEMLSESSLAVKVAGNIGLVATEIAQTVERDESLVLELSSFQLLGIQRFKPSIAVLLNIFEAHLDYHKTMENYMGAKFNIFRNQTETDYLVYNADDTKIVTAIEKAPSIKVPFSVTQRLPNGAWMDQDYLYYREEKVMPIADIVLVGAHNLENILAAIAAAKLRGATNEGIYKVLTTFSGVKHRLQFVDNIKQRLFYNDSKATNMLATQKALSSFKQPVILLAGGLDRGNDFQALLPYLKHVKGLVVFGQTAEKLKKLGEQADITNIVAAEDVEDAVVKAYQASAEEDVILLSPACASWDQYRTFEERGDMFIQAVHRLK